MTNLTVKLVDEYRKRYGLFLDRAQIGYAEINFVNKTLEVFEMELNEKFRKQGHGEFFLNWLIENIGKPKNCTMVKVKWIQPYLINSLRNRDFNEITEKSNVGVEISFIKNLN